MSSTAQQRLGAARASLATAEIAVAAERAAALDQQLSDAVAEVRGLDAEIVDQGKRLFEAKQDAESLWARRALVQSALRNLEADLPDFPLVNELEEYQQKRSVLVDEFESLSRQISDASVPVAQGNDVIQKLTWAKHRAELAVSDLRIAVREARTGARQRL